MLRIKQHLSRDWFRDNEKAERNKITNKLSFHSFTNQSKNDHLENDHSSTALVAGFTRRSLQTVMFVYACSVLIASTRSGIGFLYFFIKG